jgi:DNA (cytosine-5)-methyltransferase 1
MGLRLLDTFCKAGGASMGYHRAGFDVVGVDIEPQPNYPFEFIQGDAIQFIKDHGHEFDAITASPPCQRHSAMTKGMWKERLDSHPDLIPATRQALIESGKPYVIENVYGAKAEMIDPVMLCGTMFGLGTKYGNQLRRHRLFECSFEILLTMQCAHNNASAVGVYGGGQNHDRMRQPKIVGAHGNNEDDPSKLFGIDARREAMGIEWMTGKELNQAIPPAYTEFIGRQLMELLMTQKPQ